MKKLLVCLVVATGFLASAEVYGQDTTTAGQDLKKAAHKTGKAIGKTAKKVGDKTAELASKGKAALVDKVYKDKSGPDGQTIYINNKSAYYWIDEKGHHIAITKSQLKDKDN
jgi:hypothetical protein